MISLLVADGCPQLVVLHTDFPDEYDELLLASVFLLRISLCESSFLLVTTFCFQWLCEFALKDGKSDESRTMGIKDLENDLQTENESRRRSGIQEEKELREN